MIDFVLSQQYEPIKGKIFKKRCTNYAEFLRMPLKLSMLIPCDENENPFKKPEFLRAKSKILFEGFSLEGNKVCYSDFYFGSIEDLENKKVEDILYEIPEEEMPFLTSTAINLIHKQ
ncbi:hypothetical protein CG08_2212 [Riemerella anatipestifer]|nr:hypothetical protein CG08_2212 [Riemerella anatipestifer]